MTCRVRLARGTTAALLLGALLAPAVRANDVAGSALDLDGTDDIVRVPYDASFDMTAAVTAEAWVMPTSADGGVVGVWGAGGLDDKFLLYFDGGKPRARIVRDGIQGTTNAIGAVLAPGAWYHLAMTYDGVTLRLYVNAGEVASTAGAGTLPLTTDRDLRFGVEDIIVGQESYLDGVIDEVRVWDVARSPTDLATFMNQTVAADTPGLVGSWRCDGASGTQAVLDDSPNGNDGTLGTDAGVAADDPTRGASTAPMRWEHLGNALAGNLGLPTLSGSGTLEVGSVVALNLERDLRPTQGRHPGARRRPDHLRAPGHCSGHVVAGQRLAGRHRAALRVLFPVLDPRRGGAFGFRRQQRLARGDALTNVWRTTTGQHCLSTVLVDHRVSQRQQP